VYRRNDDASTGAQLNSTFDQMNRRQERHLDRLRLLLIAMGVLAIIGVLFAALHAVFPPMKFSTTGAVESIGAKFVDRQALTESEAKSLDRLIQGIRSNDRILHRVRRSLARGSMVGFAVLGCLSFWSAHRISEIEQEDGG
jgi:hypothetical protein